MIIYLKHQVSRSQTTTIIHHQHRVVEGDHGDHGDHGDPVQVWSFCVNNYNYHQHPAHRHPALTIGISHIKLSQLIVCEADL